MESFGGSPEEDAAGGASKKSGPSPSEIRYYEGGGDLAELEGKVFDVSDIESDRKERQELRDTIEKIDGIVNETIYEVSDQDIVEAIGEYSARDEAEDKLAAEFFGKGEEMDEAHRVGKEYAEAGAAVEALEPPAAEQAKAAVRDGKLPEANQEALRRKMAADRAMLEVAKADVSNLFNRFAETYAMDPDTLLEEKAVSKLAAFKMGLRSIFRPKYRKLLKAYEEKIAEVNRLETELADDNWALNDPAGYADEMNRRMLRSIESNARLAGVFPTAPPGGRREVPVNASIAEATDDEIAAAAEEIRGAKMAEISARAEKIDALEPESPMETEIERAWEKEGIKMDLAHAEGLDYAAEKEVAEAPKVPTREEAEALVKRGEITPEMIKAAHDRMAEREVEIKVAKHQLDDIEDKMLRKYGLNPAILLKEKTLSKSAAIKTGLRSLFDGGFRKMMRRYEELVELSGRLKQEQADDDLLTKDPRAFGIEMARRTMRAMVAGARSVGSAPKGTLGVGPARG